MSGVLNDCDALLQAASVRVLNPANAWINLATSAPGFHLTAAGVADLAVVTVTADLIGLDDAISFSAVGGTLSNATGNSVDVTYTGSTAIVTATVVSGGEEFKRSCVIPVLRDGAAGTPAYTWIKYADTAAGAGISDDPAGKAYIGLAHNKPTATESTTPGDYTWAQMKGGDGVAGAKGADGITYYTWIKYADQADGTGLYDAPTANTLYIGIAVNRLGAAESTTKTDYIWSRFKGEQGVAGATTYTWIKYADTAAGAGLADDPTGKTYIGFAYNKASATESTTPGDYTWSLIKGTDGQPGGTGATGATLYTWIKYSDVADGTGLYDLPTASTLYIGIATNKSTATESTVKTDYVWSKFKGDQGVQGPTTYTWVKYADSAAGVGLSDDPTGKTYIGFAYNKPTATESTTATDYAWSLIKGADGQPGGKGADGATLYTWIKYSDNADGTGLYDLPTASTQYLGIAVNKATATESTVKSDYVWSKFRGADGVGTAGARGAGHYYVAGSSWSDVVAQAACPGGPVVNDVVTISSGTFVMEKRWTGSAWVDNGVVINGKLIVPDSILASSIDTRGLTVRAPDGTVVLDAGKTMAQQTMSSPNLAARISSWGTSGGAGYVTGSGDTRFINGEYLYLPANQSTPLGLSNQLNIPANAVYTVSFDAYVDSGTKAVSVNVYGVGIDSVGAYEVLGTAIKRYRFTETMPNNANAPGCQLRAYSGSGAGNIVVSNIKVALGANDTSWNDSVVTPGNSSQRVMPDSITNVQFGGDLVGALWNGNVGPGGAGWLLQRNGMIYVNGLHSRGALMGGDYSAYDWVTGDRADGSRKRGFYLGEAGLLLGNPSRGGYAQITDTGEMRTPNITSVGNKLTINGDTTINGALLVNPQVTNPIYSPFTVSIGGAIDGGGSGKSIVIGTRTATITGPANLKSIMWVVTDQTGDSSISVANATSQTATFRSNTGTTPANGEARVTCTIVGHDGRTHTDSVMAYAEHA